MKLFTILLLSLLFYITSAQTLPKGYFMFPIKPNQTNYLSANMGELRPNHFHAGIDIKTDARTGLPVYAAQSGYVSRLRVSSYGYGNTVYITHPNGLVTVYAHLESFAPAIKNKAQTEQYKNEEFEFDILLSKNEIKIKKGEIIGASGNSGSSGGPHLHFEIRDSLENVLNPLLCNFPELKDQLTPVIQKIIVRPLNINARVHHEFSRREFVVSKRSESDYYINNPIDAFGDIGIELKMFDRMNGTSNSYGVNCIEMFVNGEEVFYHNLQSFAFDESKFINIHIDFEHFVATHQRFEKCYIADGNRFSSYKKTKNQGRLHLKPNETKQVVIKVYDSFGNKSTLQFTLKGAEGPKPLIIGSSNVSPSVKVDENTLIMSLQAEPNQKAQLYFKNKAHAIEPAYRVHLLNVYLYDLRKGLPDSVQCGNTTENLHFIATVLPKKNTTVKFKNLTISFADTTLFDTLYLQAKTEVIQSGHETFEICNTSTPIFGKIGVKYCPDKIELLSKQCYIYSLNGKSNHKFEGGEWNDNNILYDIKYLGKFAVKEDKVPPVVKLRKTGTKSIVYTIYDTGSGIKSFRATLNGKWILMNYDHKTATLWSEALPNNGLIKGNFQLEVIDKSNNTTTTQINLP